jgi:hypothetical protein
VSITGKFIPMTAKFSLSAIIFLPIRERLDCGHDQIMLKGTDPDMKTIYCLFCGQEWKSDDSPSYRYVRDYEYWSPIIENEANRIASESGRKEKVKFRFSQKVTKVLEDGTVTGRGDPELDCDYYDFEGLIFIARAIWNNASSMPPLERYAYLGLADMFEGWVSRKQKDEERRKQNKD